MSTFVRLEPPEERASPQETRESSKRIMVFTQRRRLARPNAGTGSAFYGQFELQPLAIVVHLVRCALDELHEGAVKSQQAVACFATGPISAVRTIIRPGPLGGRRSPHSTPAHRRALCHHLTREARSFVNADGDTMIKEIFPSLFWIRSEGRAPGTPFTYFLRRAAGNILFGTKDDISSFAGALKSMGGIKCILLGDRHHALPHSAAFAQRMGTVLTASDIEAKALESAGVEVGTVLPHARTSFADDLEIIPTPGHTRGAFSYVWTNGKKRFLFVGDTLVPENGAWKIYVTRPNRPEMARTIHLLSTVKFDVILSNSFAAVPVPWIEVTPKTRFKILSDVLDELSR